MQTSAHPRRPTVDAIDRISTGAAWLASVGCLLLGAVQSVIFNGAEAPPFAQWFAGQLSLSSLNGGPAARLIEQPSAVYFTFGRGFMLVYLALAIVLVRSPLRGRLGSGFSWLLAIAAWGDFLAYWCSAAAGPAVRTIGFWMVEVPALTVALLLLTMYGVHALRSGERHAASWLAATAPLGALLGLGLLRYMPHGLVLPLALFAVAKARQEREATPARRWSHRGIALVVAILASGAVALPYRPILIAGAEPPPAPYTMPARREGMRLHIFNTGMNRMSALLVGERRPWRPAPAFVIEHPREGLVVFDCGLSEAVAHQGESALHWPMPWLFESRGEPGYTLADQMREAGLDPRSVARVVLSHLHADHVGDPTHFERAAFFAGPGADPLSGASNWNTVTVDAASGAFDLLGDASVQLRLGGGHTREDVMAFIGLPQGPVLLTGDVVVHHDWLASEDVERIATDPNRAAADRNRIRTLAQSGVLVIPGHDLSRIPPRDDIVIHHPKRFSPEAWSLPSH